MVKSMNNEKSDTRALINLYLRPFSKISSKQTISVTRLPKKETSNKTVPAKNKTPYKIISFRENFIKKKVFYFFIFAAFLMH